MKSKLLALGIAVAMFVAMGGAAETNMTMAADGSPNTENPFVGASICRTASTIS